MLPTTEKLTPLAVATARQGIDPKRSPTIVVAADLKQTADLIAASCFVPGDAPGEFVALFGVRVDPSLHDGHWGIEQ